MPNPIMLAPSLNVADLKWVWRVPGMPLEGFIAEGGAVLFGMGFHVEARPVVMNERGQYGASMDVEDEISALQSMTHAQGPFETIKVNGVTCVVTLTPHCR